MPDRLSAGIDLLEIERLQRAVSRYGERFLQRIFTNQERTDVQDNLASLAARFAAKEAAAKALGCGIGEVSWQEIEICRGLLVSHCFSYMAGRRLWPTSASCAIGRSA